MTQPLTSTSVLHFGAPLQGARAVMILTHGRGAGAQSMRPLAEAWARPGLAFLAPQAPRPDATWYPYSFLAPLDDNQPHLEHALALLDRLVEGLINPTNGQPRLPVEKLLLGGFSQGASLTVEYAARHARRYGGLAVLSGGLIGLPETPRDYPGAFDGARVFLGCSDVDPYIPKERVLESERVLTSMGARVTTRLYPNLPHTVNDDEIAFVAGLIEQVMI